MYYVQDGVPAEAVAAGGELEAMAEVVWGRSELKISRGVVRTCVHQPGKSGVLAFRRWLELRLLLPRP